MPARDCVWRCSRVALLSRMDGALSVGCQNSSFCRRVEVTEHPFLGCHASVRSLCCVAALGARFAAGCRAALAALVTNAPQRWRKLCCVLQWIYQDVWLYMDSL